MANRYPLIVNPSTNQIQEIPFGDVLNLDGSDVNQINVSGVTTSVGGFVGNLTGTATTSTNVIGGIGSVTSLSVSGVTTLGAVRISSGIVTASSGIVTYYGDGSKLQNITSGVGIQSSGTVVGSGITTLNFIGAGNTFAVNGSTVDISIQGSAGGESYWALSTLGIHTTSNVGIATTNPIQPLQVGSAGTSVVVVDALGDVGIGTTNPTTKLHVVGDINLDDGGSFVTTVQCVTPTANRTISFPDSTGTVALVAGSSGQLIYNFNGSYSGVLNSGIGTTTGNITLGSRFISSLNGSLSVTGIDGVPVAVTGTWITGGTSTTNKPHVLIEPSTVTTSNAWSTAGTGLGVNAPSGFAGNLLDLQVNGASRFAVTASAYNIGSNPTFSATGAVSFNTVATGASFYFNATTNGTVFFANRFGQALNNSNGSNVEFHGTDIGFGTNLTGGNCTVRGGSGRGSGAGGSIVFSTAPSGASGSAANAQVERFRINVNGELVAAEGSNIALGTTTGSKIGTATTQKLGFYNATPVVQPAAVADITTTATTGSLPMPNGTVTIANAAAPTVSELLEYCVELEAKLEAALSRLRDLGLIAT